MQFHLFLFTWFQNSTLRFTKILRPFGTLSPDSLPGLCCTWTPLLTSIPKPLLDDIILGLRSGHDQDAEGVEGKGNGDDSGALEARQKRLTQMSQRHLLLIDIHAVSGPTSLDI